MEQKKIKKLKTKNCLDKDYFKRLKKDLIRYKSVYLLFLIPMIWYIIFCYVPMYGLLMAFQDFNIRLGVSGSEWVGFENFIRFFNDPYFSRYIINTIRISLWALAVNFPVPIIFAVLINELRGKLLAKTVQTVTYMPHFISLVVICGMVQTFVGADGIITSIMSFFTGKDYETTLLNNPDLFAPIFVLSGTWQGTGFASIIFVAALAGIDQSLYEAASIDGAGYFKKFLHVTIPGIMPTIVVMFILRLGSVLNTDYQKVLLLLNQLNAEKAEVLSYYVYEKGIGNGDYGISTAAGLFNSIINIVLVIAANAISRKVSESSLW